MVASVAVAITTTTMHAFEYRVTRVLERSKHQILQIVYSNDFGLGFRQRFSASNGLAFDKNSEENR